MAKTSSLVTAVRGRRAYFTHGVTGVELPDLVNHQNKSFQWFINEGLGELLAEISPIDDYTGAKLTLSFKHYKFGEPKLGETEARDNNVSYEAPLMATVELINKVTGEIKEQEIYLGDYPW
ncbi:MAG: DNA-directed RNA polymerase subunit beta, partial [Candidatus Micrarchaeaceae archaeon]